MKIGILTYHAACNFGANLQVHSTFEYLKKAGHEPVIINWFSKEFENYYKKTTPQAQYDVHENYRTLYFDLTERCYDTTSIAREIINNNLEGIIIGSDAVLQHHSLFARIIFPTKKIISIKPITKDRLYPNPFWGDFYPHLNKEIPMALISASSQNSDFKLISHKIKKEMKNSLSLFSYISVRDEWTQKMVRNIFNKKLTPEITPDPVFGFNYSIKSPLEKVEILDKYNLPENYLLFSFYNSKSVTQNWLSEFKIIASKNNYTCVAMAMPNGIKFQHPFDKIIDIPLSPIDWYQLIKYSSGYIGNNMHPIVVCLHNAIPCFSFDNYGIVKLRAITNQKSSKIYHILKEFDLLDIRVTDTGVRSTDITAESVFSRIMNFPKERVAKQSLIYVDKYKSMMNKVLQAFS